MFPILSHSLYEPPLHSPMRLQVPSLTKRSVSFLVFPRRCLERKLDILPAHLGQASLTWAALNRPGSLPSRRVMDACRALLYWSCRSSMSTNFSISPALSVAAFIADHAREWCACSDAMFSTTPCPIHQRLDVAGLVVLELQIVDEVSGVVGRRLHRHHARCLLRCDVLHHPLISGSGADRAPPLRRARRGSPSIA